MSEKALVVLAAGMGSRYGGLKQMDPLGPAGEFIIDYSVYDAVRAGFDAVVFVIRRDIEAEFRATIGARVEEHVTVRYAFQEREALPEGFTVPAHREKPWGTAHALLCARDQVPGGCAVINADDFYGRRAYDELAALLDAHDDPALHGMVGYRLDATVPSEGSVSRGCCAVDPDGLLRSIEETHGIARSAGGFVSDSGPLQGDETVSMNCWGFRNSIFDAAEKGFRAFLTDRAEEPKAEFYIPAVVDTLIRSNAARFRVVPGADRWLGITHRSDRPHVVRALAELVDAGEYPSPLWS